jgi:glycosyltransferase involved in cell wall biosynthesis
VRRLNVLLSAYACAPGMGSEHGVGWSMVREMVRYHDVWVLTRQAHRANIERALRREPMPARFIYYDLPRSLTPWKRGARGVHLYYYLWQSGVCSTVRALRRAVRFDVIHHVTLAKYWAPSFLALLPVPFVLGPVGGAESVPPAFWPGLSWRGKQYEALRTAGRWLGEHDPFVRLAIRRSAVVFAKTEQAARRLRLLGATDVRVLPGEGLPPAEIARLARYAPSVGGVVRFATLGNLLSFKGLHLGLRAFAQAALPTAEYWIIGDGPERRALETLARSLGVGAHVRFWGWLPREEALRRLAESQVLVHPSLHESGSWVCVEAMAAGVPVICFDLGGPGAQIDETTGMRVRAADPQQAVQDLACAMRRLAGDHALRAQMGKAGRRRNSTADLWAHRGEVFNAVYRDITERAGHPRVDRPTHRFNREVHT